METVRKKFRPLVERGSLLVEKYVETFEGTESAPASDDAERSCSLLTFPDDVMRNIAGSERLNM